MVGKKTWMGLWFLLPALILLTALIIFPLINALTLSFQKQMIYELDGRFVGFRNYAKILKSTDFWMAFVRSVIWTGSTLLGQLLIGTLSALLLHREFKGRGLARAFVLLPFFIPTVSATLMWQWLLNANYGIVSYWLNLLLGRINAPIMWLTSNPYAFVSVIMIGIWRFFPFVTINVLARLQTIPEELYEAARIDGANSFQLFWYITTPAIKEVFLVVALLRGIFMINKFDIIYMLTAGGPGTSTETLPLYIYNYSFTGMRIGYGSAASILLFLLTLAFILTYMRSTKAELLD